LERGKKSLISQEKGKIRGGEEGFGIYLPGGARLLPGESVRDPETGGRRDGKC